MKPSNLLTKYKLNKHKIDNVLLNQARKEKNIVYGGQAIKKKIGIFARSTNDYDFFSKNPKKSSNISQEELDKLFRKDVFFNKKGANKTTWKVKFVGKDGKKNTSDDIGVADYTRTPKPTPKTFIRNGIKYRGIQEELEAKKRLIENEKYGYRKEKDLKDYNKIKKYGGVK